MNHVGASPEGPTAEPVWAVEESFSRLVEEYRRELQVHCYRMVGSYEDSEDLVQETFLRAWRKRDASQGPATFRAWLYRIATNVCLDFLDRTPRSPVPRPMPEGSAPGAPPAPDDIPWLQPYPDRLLDLPAPSDAEPDAAVVAKETIELAFLIAIQYLPARQRAALIMRDVLGWPANDVADMLDTSVASVNSALQRARSTVKRHLPARRIEWAAAEDPSEAERALLRKYMSALDTAGVDALAELLTEDVRVTMPPHPMWFQGRDVFINGIADMLNPDSPAYAGAWRSIPTRANRQPAVAQYIRPPGEAQFQAQVLDVLWIRDGRIAEVTAFGSEMFAAFDLPLVLPETTS